MKRGEIIFSPQFKFEDGGTSEKLLIVLNEATSTTHYLLLLATTKQRNKTSVEGCHAKKGYFVVHPNTDFFNQITWIMFDRIYEYTLGRELKEYFEGNLAVLTTLKANTINAIINCLKQSDDITPYQLSLLK
jgi:hypothetical protein